MDGPERSCELAIEGASPAHGAIAVAGHICLDIIPTLTRSIGQIIPGSLVEAGPVVVSTGGAVANTGLALQKLGARVHLIGKVGNDRFGGVIRSLIAQYGSDLDKDMIVALGETSSYSIILSSPGTDRMFIHAPGCNATFRSADISGAILEASSLFHFGYPPLMACMCQDNGSELAALFRQCKAYRLTTSLDMSLPDPKGPTGWVNWKALLTSVLPMVDVFLPSIEELLFMLRRPAFERLVREVGVAAIATTVSPNLVSELGQELIEMGTKIAGVKMGSRGLYSRTAGTPALGLMGRTTPSNIQAWANRELWAPCFATTVIGTTGSGDATIAGFLFALLQDKLPEATLTCATAVGACCVEASDALSNVQNWLDTERRIAAGWQRLPLQLNTPGWHWDVSQQLWVGPQDKRPGRV